MVASHTYTQCQLGGVFMVHLCCKSGGFFIPGLLVWILFSVCVQNDRFYTITLVVASHAYTQCQISGVFTVHLRCNSGGFFTPGLVVVSIVCACLYGPILISFDPNLHGYQVWYKYQPILEGP